MMRIITLTGLLSSATPMTMAIEKVGTSGAKFTYRMPPGFTPNMLMTFETQFDGKEVPGPDGKTGKITKYW